MSTEIISNIPAFIIGRDEEQGDKIWVARIHKKAREKYPTLPEKCKFSSEKNLKVKDDISLTFSMTGLSPSVTASMAGLSFSVTAVKFAELYYAKRILMILFLIATLSLGISYLAVYPAVLTIIVFPAFTAAYLWFYFKIKGAKDIWRSLSLFFMNILIALLPMFIVLDGNMIGKSFHCTFVDGKLNENVFIIRSNFEKLTQKLIIKNSNHRVEFSGTILGTDKNGATGVLNYTQIIYASDRILNTPLWIDWTQGRDSLFSAPMKIFWQDYLSTRDIFSLQNEDITKIENEISKQLFGKNYFESNSALREFNFLYPKPISVSTLLVGH